MEMNEILTLNSQGLIPGPGESETAFLERVQLVKEFFHAKKNAVPSHRWQWASEQLRALYDFTPCWCVAEVSKQGLAPWQPAATWIDVKRIYTIRVRPAKWVSWLIDVDELLAHEAVHAARAAFDEPKTEEIFAYLTSSAKWRQVIGPIFSRPWEALLWTGLIMAGALFQGFDLISSSCFVMAGLMMTGWSLRLLHRRMMIQKAARQIQPLLKDPKRVRAVLFRLTDAEIRCFARKEFPAKDDLRWQLLQAAYFINPTVK